MMFNPTCPHCHTPQEAIAALPFAGGLAIILECGEHQSVTWKPQSRFTGRLRLSDLTNSQKSHLAWRLDHNTWCGYITAGRFARGDFGDLLLTDIFELFDKSSHSAKILARKVIDFNLLAILALTVAPPILSGLLA